MDATIRIVEERDWHALTAVFNHFVTDSFAAYPEEPVSEDFFKKKHLDSEVIVHPENTPEVIEVADRVESTGGMLKYMKDSDNKSFIVGTEIGIIHRLKKENPDKEFIPAFTKAICPNMKLTNLEKILWSLEGEETKIEVPEDIAVRAKSAIDRMIALK